MKGYWRVHFPGRADLTFDASGAWVPAGKDDEVVAPTGAIYFHSIRRTKATGSYFTKVVVDHLVERSIVPVLTKRGTVAAYLAKGDAAAAARSSSTFALRTWRWVQATSWWRRSTN